jgi:hypothetical protein
VNLKALNCNSSNCIKYINLKLKKMIKRKVNLDDKRNIKLSLSCSKIESKIIENLSKELKTSKTEVIILAVKKYEELIKKN